MKKTFLICGTAAILLASCAGNEKKLNEDSAKIADLTEEYKEASDFNDSLMLLMGDIYTGLDSINMQEGLLYNMNQGDNADRRAEIRRNLAAIKARLNANKQLLADMEAKVKNSGNQNSVNNTVAQKEEEVKAETAAKEQAQQEAVAAENEANKVFYAIGTNKELKKNGLLEKKFLGATKVMKGNYNAAYFTTADKRNITTIPTTAKKVKVWSNMPADSYQIVSNADGIKSIKITNPAKFWSLTPYLIIQVD